MNSNTGDYTIEVGYTLLSTDDNKRPSKLHLDSRMCVIWLNK